MELFIALTGYKLTDRRNSMFKTILFLMGIIGTALSGLIYLGTDIDTVKEMGPLIIITTTAITAPYSFFSWFEEKDNNV